MSTVAAAAAKTGTAIPVRKLLMYGAAGSATTVGLGVTGEFIYHKWVHGPQSRSYFQNGMSMWLYKLKAPDEATFQLGYEYACQKGVPKRDITLADGVTVSRWKCFTHGAWELVGVGAPIRVTQRKAKELWSSLASLPKK